MRHLATPWRAPIAALALCLMLSAAGEAAAQSVIATVPVGVSPTRVDLNTATNKVYVVNTGDNSVSVIDGATNTVTTTINNVGSSPADVAANSVTNKIYVAGAFSGSVLVINGASDMVTGNVPTAAAPFHIALNSVTNRIYASTPLNGAVAVLDGATDTVITNIPVPSGVHNLAVNTATNKIYVCNASNAVSVIDGATNTVSGTITVGSSPQRVGVNPVTNRIYVANFSSMNVTVIDGATDTVITTVSVVGNPFGVGVDTEANKVFVPSQSSAGSADPVSVINGTSNLVSATFTVGDQPTDAVVNPSTRRAYVTNQASRTVSVVAILSDLLISEFRTRALGNTQNDYVELYNNTDAPLTVSTDDGSTGWAVTSLAPGGSSSTTHVVITNGTMIPARGHYLVASSPFIGGYALTGYAVPDRPMIPPDVPDNTGVAVFRTSNPSNFTLANRLDAVSFNNGFTGPTADLYREGTPLPAVSNSDAEHAFVRRFDTLGFPVDTEVNANDFDFVSTNGATQGGVASVLGAPGPEASNSPVRRGLDKFPDSLIDPAQPASAAPNRVRDMTPVTNGANGTITIRRRFTNMTGQSVTRLRFRIREITTFNSPNVHGGLPQADLRALSSSDTIVMLTGGGMTTARGTTLEQPPTQSNGGGLNSSLAVSSVTPTAPETGAPTRGRRGVLTVAPGEAGGSETVTLGAPLANGGTIDVQFVFGVQTNGKFRVFVVVEALP